MNPQTLLILAASVPDGRLFGLDAQTFYQIVAQLFNIGLLAFLMGWLLNKPVREFLQKRADGIRGQLDQADRAVVKANELKLQYEQKLRDIDLERDEILETARKQAAESARRITDEAKREAEAAKARAAANIEAEWAGAQAEMKLAIIEAASLMAEKLIERSMDGETHERLFAETMAELEEMKWRS